MNNILDKMIMQESWYLVNLFALYNVRWCMVSASNFPKVDIMILQQLVGWFLITQIYNVKTSLKLTTQSPKNLAPYSQKLILIVKTKLNTPTVLQLFFFVIYII